MKSFALKLVLTVGVLFVVILQVPADSYLDALDRMSLALLAILGGLAIVQVVLLALRWGKLTRMAHHGMPFSGAFCGILMSLFFSQGLPASVGGDVFRLWWHRRHGIDRGDCVRIVLFDRLYGVVSLLLLCGVSVLVLVNTLGWSPAVPALIAIMACGLLGFVFLFQPRRFGISSYLSRLATRLPHKLGGVLSWLLECRSILLSHRPIVLAQLLALGCIVHFAAVLMAYAIGDFLQLEGITFINCVAAVPPALLIGYMPFSIAGWGVREASMVGAFAVLGVDAEPAILMSIIIGTVILCISLIGGLIWSIGGFSKAFMKSRREDARRSQAPFQP